jgi:cytochrome c556
MGARRAGALVALLFVTLACSLTAQRVYEERLDTTPGAAQHGVHSERLRQLMQGLDRLQHDRLPQSLDVGEERARRVEEVADVARAMADSAQQISDPALTDDLDAAARAEFVDYAELLASHVGAVADQAPELSPQRLRQRVAETAAICDGCHARFRIPMKDSHEGIPMKDEDAGP